MAQKSLLEICQEAVNGVKDVETPTVIVGSSSPTAILLKSMATKVGRELERGFNWQSLKREHTIATTGVADYDLPSDWRRQAALTGWDRTGARPLIPANAATFQALKSSVVVAGISYYFTVSQGQFHFSPAPASGLTLAMDYYTSQFIEDGDGNGLDDWDADDNLCRLDGDLMVLGVTYRYLARQGAPFAEEKADYIQAIKDLQNDDTPMPVIDTGPCDAVLPYGQFPAANWDLT